MKPNKNLSYNGLITVLIRTLSLNEHLSVIDLHEETQLKCLRNTSIN